MISGIGTDNDDTISLALPPQAPSAGFDSTYAPIETSLRHLLIAPVLRLTKVGEDQRFRRNNSSSSRLESNSGNHSPAKPLLLMTTGYPLADRDVSGNHSPAKPDGWQSHLGNASTGAPRR